ncbi:hypothetical protein ETAR_06890 [Edwardsiella tarda]
MIYREFEVWQVEKLKFRANPSVSQKCYRERLAASDEKPRRRDAGGGAINSMRRGARPRDQYIRA